ncbi:hypothetical protein HY045_01435 [Candidatus Woesebacteria bacterium]|nr:hypothetical protein [Candidatus Woesebacteria bacterium]
MEEVCFLSSLLLSDRKEFNQAKGSVRDTLSSLLVLNRANFGLDIIYLRNRIFLESLWDKIIEGYNDKKNFVFSQEFPEAVILAEYLGRCNLEHLHHLLSVRDGVEPLRPYERYDISDGHMLHKSPKERVAGKRRMTKT